MTGPFETEAEASATPAVRAVYDAFDRRPVVGGMQPHNYRMLADAITAAGVELGAYDDRIVHWLAMWEPATCAAIAGIVSRAAAGAQARVAWLAHQAIAATYHQPDVAAGADPLAIPPNRIGDDQ